MLVEAVRHLLEGEPRVLQADLLADDVERQRREAPMHLAHHARQHGAVAHAGVEHAQRRRRRMQVLQLEPDAVGDRLLLAAGVDEQQVLLPVVEEAEVARGRILRLRTRRPAASAAPASRAAGASARAARSAPLTPCVVRNSLTRSSVSGVILAPSRSRATNFPSFTARRPKVEFGHVGPAAELRNAVQQPDSLLHRLVSLSDSLSGRVGQTLTGTHRGTTTTNGVHGIVGLFPLPREAGMKPSGKQVKPRHPCSRLSTSTGFRQAGCSTFCIPGSRGRRPRLSGTFALLQLGKTPALRAHALRSGTHAKGARVSKA